MQLIKESNVDFSKNIKSIVEYGTAYIQTCLPTLRNYLINNKQSLETKESGVPVTIPFYHIDLAMTYFLSKSISNDPIELPLKAFVYRFLIKHNFIENDNFIVTRLFPRTSLKIFYLEGFLSAWDTPELQQAAKTLRQMLAESSISEKPKGNPQVQIRKEPSFPKYDMEVPEEVYIDALQILEEWVSCSRYYQYVSNWFNERKNYTDFSIGYFPYNTKATGFLKAAVKANKINTYFTNTTFCKLIRIMAFNYYAEEFLGKSLPLDNNITVIKKKPTKTPMIASWDENPFEETQKYFELVQTHFNKVETIMNTLTKFESVPSANVHLIHGRPAKDYTEEQLMELIRKARKAQESIKDLINESSRMKKKHEELEEAIKVYVAALDALA